jgi:hypothetical protein
MFIGLLGDPGTPNDRFNLGNGIGRAHTFFLFQNGRGRLPRL